MYTHSPVHVCWPKSTNTRVRVRDKVSEGRLPHATLPVAWITLISPLCPTSSIRLPDVDKELTALQHVLRKYGNAVAAKLTRLCDILIRHQGQAIPRATVFFARCLNILTASKCNAILLETSCYKMHDETSPITLSRLHWEKKRGKISKMQRKKRKKYKNNRRYLFSAY